MLDSVAIDAKRDALASFNAPPVTRKGEDIFADECINSWAYLDGILKNEPDNTEKCELIQAIRKNYAGVSLLEDIQRKKAVLSAELASLDKSKKIPEGSEGPTPPMVHLFQTAKPTDFEKKLGLESELGLGLASELVSSALYASTLHNIMESDGKEWLEFAVASSQDTVHYIDNYHGVVVDLSHHIIRIPKDQVMAILEEDDINWAGDKSIWDTLKEELGKQNISLKRKS